MPAVFAYGGRRDLAFSRLIEAFGIWRLAISIGEQDDLKSFADDFYSAIIVFCNGNGQ